MFLEFLFKKTSYLCQTYHVCCRNSSPRGADSHLLSARIQLYQGNKSNFETLEPFSESTMFGLILKASFSTIDVIFAPVYLKWTCYPWSRTSRTYITWPLLGIRPDCLGNHIKIAAFIGFATRQKLTAKLWPEFDSRQRWTANGFDNLLLHRRLIRHRYHPHKRLRTSLSG